MWDVEILLDGCAIPYRLCTCEKKEYVIAIVDALLDTSNAKPIVIKRSADVPQTAEVLKGPWPNEVT